MRSWCQTMWVVELSKKNIFPDFLCDMAAEIWPMKKANKAIFATTEGLMLLG
jgi:hypothetical protein